MIKLYLLSLSGIFGVCFITWLWYLRTKLASVIDVAWSLGILTAGAIYIFMGEANTRTLLVVSLLGCWSLRLSLYLYWSRVRVKMTDQRYENLSSNWSKKNISFLFHYLFQGCLMSIIAVPFYFIGTQSQEIFQTLDYIALSLFIIALLFETLADWQLSNHKKKSKALCEKGLWKYSRHPNYFFEWLIWISFALWAFRADYGYIAMISPLALLIIVTAVTGPMTERASLKSRGQAFKDYQDRTSYFVPWFRKRV